MLAEWSPSARSTEGTLAYNFLNNDQALEYILGSIRAMASDELASARMSSGLELGDPEEEHDCFSDLSHVAIYYNFQGVRNAFYGRYGEVDGASVADLILQKNPETYFEINAKLNDIETLMAKIFAAGERNENTVRYDQIIGQASDGVERIIAESAVDQLIDIDSLFVEAQEILALSEIIIVGGGD
jgi:putative iron-regulated protein